MLRQLQLSMPSGASRWCRAPMTKSRTRPLVLDPARGVLIPRYHRLSVGNHPPSYSHHCSNTRYFSMADIQRAHHNDHNLEISVPDRRQGGMAGRRFHSPNRRRPRPNRVGCCDGGGILSGSDLLSRPRDRRTDLVASFSSLASPALDPVPSSSISLSSPFSKAPVLFVGGGKMAEAMIRGLLSQGKTPGDLSVCDPSPNRRKHLSNLLRAENSMNEDENTVEGDEEARDRRERERQLSANVFKDANDALEGLSVTPEMIVLCCKPNDLPSVFDAMRGKLRSHHVDGGEGKGTQGEEPEGGGGGGGGETEDGTCVISVCAGVASGKIVDGLAHSSVVRCMPNTPATVQCAMSVWFSAEAVSVRQKEMARNLFASFGEECLVNDEDYLDMATALSGTGPAYYFLIQEALIDAGTCVQLTIKISIF